MNPSSIVVLPMSDSTVTFTCPSDGEDGVDNRMVCSSITVMSTSMLPKRTTTSPSNPFPEMTTDVPPDGDPKIGVDVSDDKVF